MIEYVEIRGSNTDVVGIIDTAKSIIWHTVYFGVGDFEIYTPATPDIVTLLKIGNYVTRTDNAEVGVIEKINIIDSEQDGTMVIATGRFVKSILDRRLIYNLSGTSNKATTLYGNVETEVRDVVKNNAIACEFDSRRNFALLALGDLSNIPLRIVDSNGNAARKQVSYDNLLTYTDGVLEEYGLAATCVLSGGKFLYKIYQGSDRSVDNAEGNAPIIFSREFDNLVSSEYLYDTTNERNVALIGGEGEGLNRFYSLLAKAESDLNRREIWVDASSITKTYMDENDVEQMYSDEQYKSMLDAAGAQEIAPLVSTESFDGVIDITNGNYLYGRDFSIGDIVTVQNNAIGVYINVRIRETIEVQDENGYAVEVKYQ